MTPTLFRVGAAALIFWGAGALAQSPAPSPGVLIAQPDVEQPSIVDTAHPNIKGRHFAPRGTFYLLSYLSAKTDKGVVGFAPGQKVTYVSANRDQQTLVVSDGQVQVEVPASKLTNDLDVAALVTRKDEASQAQINAYAQAELEQYTKSKNAIAQDTAKDLERHNDEEAAKARKPVVTTLDQPPIDANAVGNGYYNSGGYGYGSPYSYFTGGATVVAPTTAAPGASSTTPPAAAAPPGKVGVPGGGGGRPR